MSASMANPVTRATRIESGLTLSNKVAGEGVTLSKAAAVALLAVAVSLRVVNELFATAQSWVYHSLNWGCLAQSQLGGKHG